MERDVPEEPAEPDDEVVYGDTDMNPNAEDQADEHHGATPPQ